VSDGPDTSARAGRDAAGAITGAAAAVTGGAYGAAGGAVTDATRGVSQALRTGTESAEKLGLIASLSASSPSAQPSIGIQTSDT